MKTQTIVECKGQVQKDLVRMIPIVKIRKMFLKKLYKVLYIPYKTNYFRCFNLMMVDRDTLIRFDIMKQTHK